MKYHLTDILDLGKVSKLLDSYSEATGMVSALLDFEGNILAQSRWKRLCMDFHRKNPETAKNCRISDTVLANKLEKGGKFNVYRCMNGLIDVAVPLMVNGEHIGNLFTGQFFLEKPDRAYFVKQAEKYGFEKESYLDAFSEIPVLNEKDIKAKLDFLLEMTGIIAELGIRKLLELKAMEELKKSEKKFRTVFEAANVGKSITLPSGQINANQALCDLLGYTKKELNKKTWQSITPKKEIAIVQAKLDPLIEGKQNSTRFDKRYIHKNGLKIWTDVNVSIVRDETEKPLYFISTIVDITEQKASEKKVNQLNRDLEDRVRRRTRELDKVNKELETFTYSVSHDLKAPLRGIEGYSKLLLDSYSQDLPPEALTFLNNIRNSTLKMNLLIEDLLEYSRLERKIFRQDRIPLKSFIHSIVDSYRDEIENGIFTLNIDLPDIEIIADSKGLAIAVRNIIDNAIKFTKNQVNPTINIDMEESDTTLILIIRDNGVGFDMKYHGKIFEIFQRLHRAEDYPGTGIGLAMVTKSMQRMNGTCRAESEPGRGARFYLEIPKTR